MTNKMHQDTLQQIVDRSELGEEYKRVLQDAIVALYEYQDQRLERIEEISLSAKFQEICKITESTKIGDIAVALAPIESTTCQDLKKITDSRVYFLDENYEELRRHLGDLEPEKIYEGTYRLGEQENCPFRYQIRFDGKHLREAQGLLYQLARLYQMENAILWAPYLRKAISIAFVDKIPEKVKDRDIDFCFKANNLSVLENHELLWNLQIEQETRKADARIPYGENLKYKFHFEKGKSGGWRFPVPTDSRVIVYDISFTNEGINLELDQELMGFTVVEYLTVDWGNADILRLVQNHKIYSNHVDKNNLSVRRILSKGDMEFAVRPFRNTNGIRCELTDNLDRICTRYASKYQCRQENHIWYLQSQHKKVKGRLKFFVEDSAAFDPKYIDDYINFVLLYLEYYYPEIEWIGGQ